MMAHSEAHRMERLFLYGPPGSGKSSLGRQLALDLSYDLIDLDQVIETQAGMLVEEIFSTEGETGFRQRESQALRSLIETQRCVVALGGGALLRAENRRIAEEMGQVICLSAPLEILLSRLRGDQTVRPLVAGDAAQKLEALLQSRSAHYASFAMQLDSSESSLSELSQQAQAMSGLFQVTGMQAAYDVRVFPGALSCLGDCLQMRGLNGPVALVTDENVAVHHLQTALDSLHAGGYETQAISLPAGESHKTLQTVVDLWGHFLQAKLERSSTIIALGGGVVGDLAGFAAATYLRGVNWVAVPTSLLSMVDASLGGKTGADLPQGKNLIGAFHAPRLVLVDPLTLATLPDMEIRNGLAEVIKHAVIGDPGLLDLCQQLVQDGYLLPQNAPPNLPQRAQSQYSWSENEAAFWNHLVRRAMAVKIQVILDDPFEGGRRASLNLGHTLGHAIEQVSGYQVRHGEAVAIGMVAVLRAANRMGLASDQFLDELQEILRLVGLPTHVPVGLDPEALVKAMSVDKKRKAGQVRFVLPIKPGEVRWGVELPNYDVLFTGE